MGCSDLCLIAVTGPLAGRVVTGNADGFRPPNVSSARDFLSWYERWLNHMQAGKDNRALGLTSPSTVASAPWGRRVGRADDDRVPGRIEEERTRGWMTTGRVSRETWRGLENDGHRPPMWTRRGSLGRGGFLDLVAAAGRRSNQSG